MVDPTGEADRDALRLDFDRRLMLRFRGCVITSDGGLRAHRELDDVLSPKWNAAALAVHGDADAVTLQSAGEVANWLPW